VLRQDGILAAQQKQTVLTHGASIYGLPALRQMPCHKWLEIAVIRMKLAGEGTFTSRADRQAAMKFAFNSAGVDRV
jgi:hypothetical protein